VSPGPMWEQLLLGCCHIRVVCWGVVCAYITGL
jgi:hypothetical protein